MNYEEFKENILGKIRDYYGETADAEIVKMNKINGLSYEGIRIINKEAKRRVFPLINLNMIYATYSNGEMDMEGCIEKICSEAAVSKITESIQGCRESKQSKRA